MAMIPQSHQGWQEVDTVKVFAFIIATAQKWWLPFFPIQGVSRERSG